MVNLKGRNLITCQEWSLEEIEFTLEFAKELKRKYYAGEPHKYLDGKTFFMIFFATSTRTRNSFEAAMTQLGGHAHFIMPETMRLAEGESIKDTVKVLSRYGHGIGIRILGKAVDFKYGEGNRIVREFAKYADIPVINMEDDMFHPCQGLADMLTIKEKIPKYSGKKVAIMWAYSPRALRVQAPIIEDMLLYTRYGLDVTIAHPPGFEIDPKMIELAKENAKESGAHVEITHDPKEAFEGAHIAFARNWTTLKVGEIGIKAELELHKKFKDWKCTMELMDLCAKNKIFMHCLPADRGYEVDDDVMDSNFSVIYDQAENRLHVQKAVLTLTMRG